MKSHHKGNTINQEVHRKRKNMHTVKEKVSNAAAAAKEHIDVMKARTEEMGAKATARTKEEKKIAEEIRKAKEAEAEMKLHQTHAENAAEKLTAKHSHHTLGHRHHPHHQPVGTTVPTTGAPPPSYPLGDHHQPIGTTVPTTGVPAPSYPLGGHHHKHL